MTKALLKTLALGATLLLVSMGSTDIAQALAATCPTTTANG